LADKRKKQMLGVDCLVIPFVSKSLGLLQRFL
jgi:hypothetical protein